MAIRFDDNGIPAYGVALGKFLRNNGDNVFATKKRGNSVGDFSGKTVLTVLPSSHHP